MQWNILNGSYSKMYTIRLILTTRACMLSSRIKLRNVQNYYDYYYTASGSSLKSLDMIRPSLTFRPKRCCRTNLCLVSLSEVTLTPGQDELPLRIFDYM